jgi:O-antigen ligase
MNEVLESLHGFLGDLHSTEQMTLLLVAGILGGIFLAWNARPQRALVAWLVTFSIQFSLGTFHLSLSDIFLVPLAVGTFIFWITRKDKSVAIPAPVLFFVFLFLTAANMVTALSLGKLPQWTWLNKDLGLLALLVPYWAMLVLCRDREETAKLIQTFVSSVSVVNAIGVALYICSLFTGFGQIVNYGGMRFKGFMLDPNGYAGLVASTAILQFAILNLNTKRGPKSLLGLLNCFLLVTGCLLTLSRGGLLSLVAGGLVFLYFTKARSSYTIIFALAGIALSLLWLSTRTDLGDFAEQRANDRGNIESRIDYMEQGMRMYLSSPRTLVTGIGIGTFVEESPKYFGDNHQIHNTYVWLLVEGGPVLLIAYLLILFRALRNNLWIYRNVPGLRHAGAGCFCALITTMFWSMTVEGMYHHHFWILLAFSELMWVHSRRELAIRKASPGVLEVASGGFAPAFT